LKFIVEAIHKDNGQDRYIAACRSRGLDVVVSQLSKTYEEQFCALSGEVFGFGSIQLVDFLSHKAPNRSFAAWDKYRCVEYLTLFGDELVNRDYAMLPFGDIFRLRWELFGRFAVDTKVFIRPDASTKTFSGAVIDLQDLASQLKAWSEYGTRSTDLVLVSRPLQLQGEWRFAVHPAGTKRVLAASSYRYQGNATFVPGAPLDAFKYVENILAKTPYAPDPIYMLDVAQLTDQSFRVVEPNALSSSAPYAMDVGVVVDALLPLLGIDNSKPNAVS